MTPAWRMVACLGVVLALMAAGFAAGVWTSRSIAFRVQAEAMAGAAKAIAEIQIVNTVNNHKIKEIIKKEPVYIDCKHSPDALKILMEIYK